MNNSLSLVHRLAIHSKRWFRYKAKRKAMSTEIYRNDRDRNGGGVSLYAKNSLSELTIKLTNDKLENITLELPPCNHIA